LPLSLMINTTQILEGPRVEPGMNVKLDTSLEHSLPQYDSNISPCSASSDVLTSERGCQHSKTVSYESYETCFHCGAFAPKNGVKNYKSKKMNYMAFFPSKTIYETMTRKSYQLRQSLNPEYAQVRQTYVEWILELAEKLRISPNSTHLGIYLLDVIMFKNISLLSKIQLYAPVCLLVAAKTIELDERIPFIPKLRRYANPSFTIDEYRRAELHILDMVDWNPQFSPAIELVEFFMCQGVLFSTDEIEENYNGQERGKWSPEGLRENTQHENTHHLEVKPDERKDAGKELEKVLSPSSKENNENSYSDTSTTGTNTDNLGTPGVYPAALTQIPAAEEDVSPKHGITAFLKQTSTPANIERGSYTRKTNTSIEKKVGEMLTSFEINYLKLSTLVLKDIEFIEWEPKVISASIIAFLRAINRIASIWNNELEIITQLKFSQVSACFELIHKKFNTVFNISPSKPQSVLLTPDNDLKLKSISNLSDKAIYSNQPKYELANKATIPPTNYNRPPINGNTVGQEQDYKPFERKPIFNYQSKGTTNMPPTAAATTTSSTAAYPYLRDDLRARPKYNNGTVNTEIPQRSAATKNTIFPPPGYQAGKMGQGYDTGSYYNSTNVSVSNTNIPVSGTTGVGSTAGSYLTSTGGQSGFTNENYMRSDLYNSKTSTNSMLSSRGSTTTSSIDSGVNYQGKAGVLKK